MARSMEWWILVAAAIAITMTALALLHLHNPAAPVRDDPISEALVGA